MKPGWKGPRREVVNLRRLSAAEKRAAGIDLEQHYALVELSCGHHVLRVMVSATATCGHCGEAGIT